MDAHGPTVGVLAPVTGGFYYGRVLDGIRREVVAAGGRVVMLQTLDAGISSDEVVGPPDFATPIAWNHFDAVISIATGTQRGYLERFRASGRPIALASDEIPGFDVPSAVPDNVGGVDTAISHLIDHGHRRIGFGGNLVQSDMRARYGGYLRAMRKRGIDPEPSWFFDAVDNGEHGGADIARRYLAAGRPVSALLLATDRNALGCLTALAEHGLAIPGDLAIIGFDGIDAGAYSEPTLSTVSQRIGAIGVTAARLALDQLAGVEVGQRVVPAELVLRESCGCGGVDGAGNVDVDRGIEFWRAQAAAHRQRADRRERWMREQYEIGIELLDHRRRVDATLSWLRGTDVRAAQLGLWEGDRSSGRLTIAGVTGDDPALAAHLGEVIEVEEFPTLTLLEQADGRERDVVIVVPVNAHGRDFGVLAMVGEVDTLSANGRETHNQWAALLATALEQRQLHAELERSEERYSLWAAATNDGLWDWDLETDRIYFSARCMQMLGHGHEPLTAPPAVWLDSVHPDDREHMRRVMSTARTTERRPVELEHRIRAADGSFRRVMIKALPVGEPDEPANRVVGSLHDVEARRRLEEQLRRQAHYDSVTGLPNRTLFLERLETAIQRANQPDSAPYAVVFFDLDGFKLVNDSLGHLAGDELLKVVGQRLRHGLRGHDVASRFGGDEFAVLFHDVEADSVRTVVERMQRSLAAPIELDGHHVTVTASAGLVTSDSAYETAEQVLRDADYAMYHAKQRQRGTCTVFDRILHTEALGAPTSALTGHR